MRVKIIRKDKTFLKMNSNKTVQRSSDTQKSKKNDIGLLGCVECSTNGDLLGETRIFVPTLGSVDEKVG